MTGQSDSPRDRTAVAINRGTRIVRLPTRAAMVVLACLVPWVVSGMAVRAEDPKAAARAIGTAGAAAAGAIARDAASAGNVPGYAGTDVPERNLTASGMEDAARTRLADGQDPGATAGRAVIEGVTARPERPVGASDPMVRRSETISASPQSSAHRADGLASGSTADCSAGLRDAQSGGSCGQVGYCVGAGCETVRSEANTGFVNAATRLNMALELGGDEFDRQVMRFFAGERQTCHVHFGGLANCCENTGVLVGLADCSDSEIELAEERNAGTTHYLGRDCTRKTLFGVCIRYTRAWCVFGSKLGRILQQQGRRQLGIGWSSCRGLTVPEIESIDFERLDLSEFTQDLMDGSREPSVSLPDAGDTSAVMHTRIRDFYRRGQ